VYGCLRKEEEQKQANKVDEINVMNLNPEKEMIDFEIAINKAFERRFNRSSSDMLLV
jgi:hypothetical protein